MLDRIKNSINSIGSTPYTESLPRESAADARGHLPGGSGTTGNRYATEGCETERSRSRDMARVHPYKEMPREITYPMRSCR